LALRARLARVEIVERAVGVRVEEDVDGSVGRLHRAAPETDTPGRDVLQAEHDAVRALVRRHVVAVVAPRVRAADVLARVLRVALEVPQALVVALAAVAVEEAVLLAVDVVPG